MHLIKSKELHIKYSECFIREIDLKGYLGQGCGDLWVYLTLSVYARAGSLNIPSSRFSLREDAFLLCKCDEGLT